MNCILVVEDEADLAVTYDRLLRRQGYRVVTAASRGEGLKAIESAPPALVIADLRLPDGEVKQRRRCSRPRRPASREPCLSGGWGSVKQEFCQALTARLSREQDRS